LGVGAIGIELGLRNDRNHAPTVHPRVKEAALTESVGFLESGCVWRGLRGRKYS
jgi:hypothetical protein